MQKDDGAGEVGYMTVHLIGSMYAALRKRKTEVEGRDEIRNGGPTHYRLRRVVEW